MVPGDFDADGDADARDYTIWRSQFGNSASREDVIDADASGNGEIDAADYVVWRNAFSPTAISTASVDPAAVPEPAGLAMILAAMLAMFLRRWGAVP
jgi:hypothetical protein